MKKKIILIILIFFIPISCARKTYVFLPIYMVERENPKSTGWIKPTITLKNRRDSVLYQATRQARAKADSALRFQFEEIINNPLLRNIQSYGTK